MGLSAAEIASLSRLLDEALALAPGEREAWLAALPSADQPQAARLREMLERLSQGEPDERLASLPRLAADDEVARNGELIGPYRLLHEIGRGGMGSVWLAERADGSFKRQVALKLPRLAWGAGLAERMAREREIGMLLEHPAIARLYDAGLDDRGRPYLALEYIDGQPLDAWCETQALDVRARLRLFVQVVRAVAYAHGRLVVHRDLKPSNVLVSRDGQAHLLDFGIAKLLGEAAPGDAGLTQQQGHALTPHYAAPEQVAGQAVTVACDVYSLGVLLYEVLTSTLPIAPKRSSQGAIEDAILQGDAPLASSRVKDRTLAKALRGEIDAILAKAMQREPGRRYATADALAQDIERHLNDEPVAARPDSVVYRLRKAVRRHWVGVSAAAAVLVAVFTGSGVAVVQAQRAAKSAERERVIKQFVVDIFRINSADTVTTAELRKLPAEMLLEHGAKLIETKFSAQAPLQAELYGVVGGIFLDMGAPEIGEQYATKQVAALAAINAGPIERASAMLLLARSYFDSRRYRDAELRIQRAILLSESDQLLNLHARIMLVGTLEKLGEIAASNRQLALIEQTLRLPTVGAGIDRAKAMQLRAKMLIHENRFDDAVPVLKKAVDVALAAEGVFSRVAVDIRIDMAAGFVQRFRFEESHPPREAALSTLRALGGASRVRAELEEAQLTTNAYENGLISYAEARRIIEQNRSSVAESDTAIPESILARIDLFLGWLALHWGDIQQADRQISSAAARLRPGIDALHERYQVTLGLAAIASLAGRHVEADTGFRELARLRTQMGRGSSPFAAEDYEAIAANLGRAGRHEDALRFLAAAPSFERVQGMAADGERTEEMIQAARARLMLDSGDPSSALQVLPAAEPPMTPFSDGNRLVRGEAMCALGNRNEGLDKLLAAIYFFAPKKHEFDPGIARDRAVAGFCALGIGNLALARQMAELARAALTAQPGVSPYYKAPLFELERALGLRRPPV